MNFFLTAIMFFLCVFALSAQKISIDFYFQHGCDDCKQVKQLINDLSYSHKLEISEHETSQKENFILLLSALKKFNNNSSNESVYIVVDDSILLSGKQEIEERLPDILSKNNNLDTTPTEVLYTEKEDRESAIQESFNHISTSAVIIGGLIDGINPCIFFTLIYLISILTVSQKRGKEMLLTGTVYCITCFVSYFLIGLLGLRAILALYNFSFMQMIVRILAVVLLGIFSILSFYDAIKHYRSNDHNATLRLPKQFTEKIHAIIKNRLRFNVFLTSVMFVSVVVTLVELPCTGQIYLPILLFIAKSEMNPHAVLFLFLYNLMFIIPLLIIFVIAATGISAIRFLQIGKRYFSFVKIGLGLLFFFLMLLTIFM